MPHRSETFCLPRHKRAAWVSVHFVPHTCQRCLHCALANAIRHRVIYITNGRLELARLRAARSRRTRTETSRVPIDRVCDDPLLLCEEGRGHTGLYRRGGLLKGRVPLLLSSVHFQPQLFYHTTQKKLKNFKKGSCVHYSRTRPTRDSTSCLVFLTLYFSSMIFVTWWLLVP